MRRPELQLRTGILALSVLCLSLVVSLTSGVNGQTTYTVTITIQGLPSTISTDIYIDGAPNSTLSGGQTRSFTFMTSPNAHIITVDYYVPNSAGLDGARYYEKDTSWLFSGAGNHTFTYTAQYYLTIETSYSSAEGEGWYDDGTTVHASLREGEISESVGIRHVFTGWAGDISGGGLTSDGILMNSPKKAIAIWKTQYFLTIESDPPNVSGLRGDGWYDANSQADFAAAAIVPTTGDTRLRFSHWSGAYSGESSTGNVLMDRPKVIVAHYIAQYLLTVQYEPVSISTSFNETHTGWYDANQNVQLGPAPIIINLSTVERLSLVAWIDDGSSSSDVSVTVFMDKARKVILSYETQYYVEVRSSYGSVSGSGWYDKGSVAKIASSTTAGTWPISYTLTGWHLDPERGSLTQTDDSWTLIVDGPYVVEAVWTIDYLPLISLFGGSAVAIAALAIGIGIAYRRGMIGPRTPMPRPIPAPARATLVCSSCRSRMPQGATFCQKCGAPLGGPTPPISLEDKVYDYIVKHEGVISLSRAAKDLRISVDELKEVAEKLKKEGRLA